MAMQWHSRAMYLTRANLRDVLNRPEHPWLNHPLPGPRQRQRADDAAAPRRPRGVDARGHAGAYFGEDWDVRELPDPDDDPIDLGEPEYAGAERGSGTTHVRHVAGGYVDLLTREDLAVWQAGKRDRRAEALRKKRRAGVVGAARRRWVWKNGKPKGRGGKGKKWVGAERRRGEDGRFIARGA